MVNNDNLNNQFASLAIHILSWYISPTHYVSDEGWFSDAEPPLDVLAKIRERKKKEEAEEQKKLLEKKAHQDKVKDEAMKRQIESMRAKLKSKTEL